MTEEFTFDAAMQTADERSEAAQGLCIPRRASDANEATGTDFMDLPRELRDRVYDLLVADVKYVHSRLHGEWMTSNAFTQDAPSAPALLRVSRQLHREYTDRLPKTRKLTFHGSAQYMPQTAIPLDAINELTLYFPVFLGHGSMEAAIEKHARKVENMAKETFPNLQSIHVKFAARGLMSRSKREADGSWSIEKPLDKFTTVPLVQSVEVFECNDHVVICQKCRDPHRGVEDTNGWDGKYCGCSNCPGYYWRWYLDPGDAENLVSKQRDCKQCGKHNFHQWGIWSRGDGWKYSLRKKYWTKRMQGAF